MRVWNPIRLLAAVLCLAWVGSVAVLELWAHDDPPRGDDAEEFASPVIAISEVYELLPGTEVTVVGRVTVASGTFFSAIENAGFALDDRTRGIFVCTETELGLRLGKSVCVVGTLDDVNGLPCIRATAVERVRRREIRLSTNNVPASAVGSIVVIQGVIQEVVPDGDFGDKVFVDDGSGSTKVFINKSTDIDLDALEFIRPGNEIRVRGFVALFPAFGEDTPELNPRSRRDIRLIRKDRDGRHR